MPSSEEESQWLVGSGGGLASSSGGTVSGTGERTLSIRGGLYTEEMTTQPSNANTAGVNTASADSAEHDLIDSTADATLLAQFHEDAIKQVCCLILFSFFLNMSNFKRFQTVLNVTKLITLIDYLDENLTYTNADLLL